MESKKLEQFLSPRRKVLSGFSLGIGVSIIVLTVLLFSNSLNTPIVSSSWPFSFSPSPSSSSLSTINQVNTSVDLVPKLDDTNVSRVSNGQGMVSEITHLGNLAEEVENRSEQERNGSVIAQKGKLVSEVVLQTTCLGNFSEKVNNGSLHGESVNSVQQICGNFSDVNSKKNISNNASDVNGNLLQDQEDSDERKNKTISSDDDSYPMKKMHESFFETDCDIFDGRWVRDNSKPYYPSGSCPYIDRDFDCHLNGRPDDEFVKWKWQPNGCDIPSLNATDFLERLRGKKMVFVGDSLNRNMWESLVCILRHSVRNKKRVFEISGKKEFKKKGFYAFRFEDYNCTVDFVAAPFLVRESSFKGRNGSFETLRLDLMDRTTSMYHDADIIVFNTGHWWTHEKTSRGEDYYQEGNNVHKRLKVLEAYKRALTTWARWVDKNIDSKRTQVFFRGYSLTHFRGGPWNSGGQCHKETEPIFNETYLAKYPSKMRALEHVLHDLKTPVVYLNISKLTDFRKDGHPSIYRMQYKTLAQQTSGEHAQDCSHWCLPGVPDTWNELLYASLLKTGTGSWRRN